MFRPWLHVAPTITFYSSGRTYCSRVTLEHAYFVVLFCSSAIRYCSQSGSTIHKEEIYRIDILFVMRSIALHTASKSILVDGNAEAGGVCVPFIHSLSLSPPVSLTLFLQSPVYFDMDEKRPAGIRIVLKANRRTRTLSSAYHMDYTSTAHSHNSVVSVPALPRVLATGNYNEKLIYHNAHFIV